MSLVHLLPHLGADSLIRHDVLRSHIEATNITPTLEFLNGLVATPERIRSNSGVLSLAICGFEKHPDRLEAHKLIRRYFVLLDCLFPHWFHVCNKYDNTLAVIFTALSDIHEVDSVDGGHTRQFECDESAMQIFLHSHTIQTRHMHREAGIRDADSVRIIRAAQDYFAIRFPIEKV